MPPTTAYESIKAGGLQLTASKQRWQKGRKAIHFVFHVGEVTLGQGTVMKYGRNIFCAQLDCESFLGHYSELYLTDNGVVLSSVDVAPMYLPSTTVRLTRRTLVVFVMSARG